MKVERASTTFERERAADRIGAVRVRWVVLLVAWLALLAVEIYFVARAQTDTLRYMALATGVVALVGITISLRGVLTTSKLLRRLRDLLP